jgi:hypothetical protein
MKRAHRHLQLNRETLRRIVGEVTRGGGGAGTNTCDPTGSGTATDSCVGNSQCPCTNRCPTPYCGATGKI